MAYTKWNREQYMKLESLIKKKASPGDMAVAMKVDKKDLSYRLHLMKVQTDIRTWTEEELDLLEKSRNIDEYVSACIDLYGKHRDKSIFISHWMNRDKYLAAWFKEKNERKKIHDLAISTKQFTEPMKGSEKPDQFPDIGEQMAKLIDRITENTAIQRDLYKIQVELLAVQKNTYELFKSKLEPEKKNGESNGAGNKEEIKTNEQGE
jgi:hypothetical protein